MKKTRNHTGMLPVVILAFTILCTGCASHKFDADEYRVNAKKPIKKHMIEIIIDAQTVHLKRLNILIDDSAGKMIKLEINNVPIILIPKTTITAVIIDKPIL